MTITPVNVSDVTEKIVEILKDNAELSDATIERSEEVNEIPGRCPWICVYRAGVDYPIRTLGLGAGYRRQRIEFIIYAQQADGTDAEECEVLLEQLIVHVISALLSDPTLGGKVDTLDEFSVRYVDYDKTENGYMQTAAIYFTAITSVK